MSHAGLDLFLFDLAGTTVRDDDFVLEAFLRTARGAGLAADPQHFRTRMGWHKQAVFEECLTAADRDTGLAVGLTAAFEGHYAEVIDERGLEPTPGAGEAIEGLLDRGIAVGFTTGFSRRTTDLVLATVGWSGLVSVASTEVLHGRPAPDLIHEAMRRAGRADGARVGTAGDTPADLEAGQAAGCGLVVGVGCGTHPLVDLARFPHTHLLPDLRALADLIDGL